MKQFLHLAAILLLAASPVVFAQQTTQSKSPSSHEATRPRNDRPRGSMDGPSYNIMPEGMGGLWWRIPGLAQKVGLTTDQQKRMDDIFSQSLQQLVQQSRELRKQRDLLQSMLDANPPDTAKLLPQLDRMAQNRALLEVARDKVLLNIRAVLTPDQWNKLQAENHHWLETHPSEQPQNRNDDRRDDRRGNHDHTNFQGKPAGGTQPPA